MTTPAKKTASPSGSDSTHGHWEPVELAIEYKPSTSIREAEDFLRLFLEKAQEAVEANKESDPRELRAFCQRLEKWLEEDHQGLDPLKTLVDWQAAVEELRSKEDCFVAIDIPEIKILKQ